jgi:hypothetical protein
MVDAGVLEVLTVSPPLPPAAYAAVCKADQKSKLVLSIAKLAQEHCDFGRMFQTA